MDSSKVLCINRKSEDSQPHAGSQEFALRFAQGCQGKVVSWEYAESKNNPVMIRGMTFRHATISCMANNRTFYYIDNGYFGNNRSKNWFRVIKNQVHDMRPTIARPHDRLTRMLKVNGAVPLKPFTAGKKIVVAPPSPKSLTIWNIDYQQWIDKTIAEIKQYTDRPIEIRVKRNRSDRLSTDTMEECLANDVHCLVTYNSVAAVEACMLGKPVFTLGPNAAHNMANHELSAIEHPWTPTEDQRINWLAHLSYSQFTYEEIANGYAWKIINEIFS